MDNKEQKKVNPLGCTAAIVAVAIGTYVITKNFYAFIGALICGFYIMATEKN